MRGERQEKEEKEEPTIVGAYNYSVYSFNASSIVGFSCRRRRQ